MPDSRTQADPALVAAVQAAVGLGTVRVAVTDCLYSCCARSWRRAGYEQLYEGIVLTALEETFMIAAPGIGTWTFMVTARYEDLVDVEVL
jgi:hypothetical protein